MKTLSRLLTTVAIVAGVAAGSQAAQAETRLALGSTNAQSAHYAYFAALANILSAHPDFQASVVETGATVDNLKRMERGQLDIGLVTTSTLYHANKGIKSFDGQPVDSKLLWAYSLAPQNVIVRRDAGIEELADLQGERIGPGQRGSSTEDTSLQVMDLLGIQPDWVRGTNGELADAIKDGRAVGFIKSAVGTKFDALTTDIATFTPVQVLGISDEQAAAIAENLPELSLVDMPGGDMEHTGPYQTWGFMIALSARPDMDEETAYQIVKAVMENTDEQAAAFPAVGDTDLAELTLKYATTTPHPGAVRYFEEAGYEVPDRLR
ncbi:TAXI family TRAP transporter solute-binding subunit [Amorphus orientalis]|uniref:TRAP transporter TAXI family solute receptor n=1 Tax=Amorphus orientalis TaxID=649198 RepID=A0AAE3VTA5_9HYPH|nr:TAXI family TRAP transporter solute-binding subunit [Amorphus orientalis]MDQ0317508.1 TRAP transporter TAXI family solute receptor [Amorphus orientalis]